jgi:hypothetical protein
MKATEAKLLKILTSVKECQQLWAGILRAGFCDDSMRTAS